MKMTLKRIATAVLAFTALAWGSVSTAQPDNIPLSVDVYLEGQSAPMFSPRVSVLPGEDADVVIGGEGTGLVMTVNAQHQGEQLRVSGQFTSWDGENDRVIERFERTIDEGEQTEFRIGADGEPAFLVKLAAGDVGNG